MHDDVPVPFKSSHNPLRDDLCRKLSRLSLRKTAVACQRKGETGEEMGRVGGGEVVGVGHGGMIEHNGNDGQSRKLLLTVNIVFA